MCVIAAIKYRFQDPSRRCYRNHPGIMALCAKQLYWFDWCWSYAVSSVVVWCSGAGIDSVFPVWYSCDHVLILMWIFFGESSVHHWWVDVTVVCQWNGLRMSDWMWVRATIPCDWEHHTTSSNCTTQVSGKKSNSWRVCHDFMTTHYDWWTFPEWRGTGSVARLCVLWLWCGDWWSSRKDTHLSTCGNDD